LPLTSTGRWLGVPAWFQTKSLMMLPLASTRSLYHCQSSVLTSMLRLVRFCLVAPTRTPKRSSSLCQEYIAEACGSTPLLVSEEVYSTDAKPELASMSRGRRVRRITVPPMPPSSMRDSGVLYSSAADSMFDGSRV